MLIFSHPKVGKTSNLMKLPNSLLIDLEDSSDFYEGRSINLKKIARENKAPLFEVLKSVIVELKSSDKKYDFIIIDTTTVIEDIANSYATEMYKKTTVGKRFEGTDVVAELERGGGYLWLRKAFVEIYSKFYGLSNKCLILLGHVKASSITKNGKELSVKDIDLTGKLKRIVSSDMDAVGYMYRKTNTNCNYLNFMSSEDDLMTGSRLNSLSGKEFLLSEVNDKNILKTFWENIFPSIKE